jgi:hypothetical protein
VPVEFALACGAGAILGGLIAALIAPLLPFNRAWTWERYKAFWRGEMPFGGF